jgi:hypothetical protein
VYRFDHEIRIPVERESIKRTKRKENIHCSHKKLERPQFPPKKATEKRDRNDETLPSSSSRSPQVLLLLL